MSKKTTNKVYVKAELLPEQKERLHQRAKEMGYSDSEFIRMKVLDDTQGKEEMIRNASRHLPSLYHLTEQVENEVIQEELSKKVSQLWQCLK